MSLIPGLNFNFPAGGGGGRGEEEGRYSGQVKTENTQSAKICLKFNFFLEGMYSGQVKTENTQSAKICLNFNFLVGGALDKSKLKILKVPRST